MAEYVTQSLKANKVDTDDFYDRITSYLKNKGMVRFGDMFHKSIYYHSDKATVALSFYLLQNMVELHVASSDAKFIDDLIDEFSLTDEIQRMIKKSI